jgi:rubredoxin
MGCRREPSAGASPSKDAGMSRWRCPGCGYLYDEQRGHPREGFSAGTPWSEVPDDWACPDCGVCDKVDFEQVPE